LAACVSVACADDLPRHGVIGLVVGARDLNEPEDPASNPPTVKKVLPGSAGQSAHIQPGDELVSVDEQPVTSSTQFALMVTRHLAGDSVHVKFLRGGEPHTVTVTLKPRPFETRPDAEVDASPS
jgi:putative serine protease PepD